MRALFLDFDGVLHRSTDIVGKDVSSLALQGSEAILATGLFRWTGLLEESLAQADGSDDIAVVVHSSWRNQRWMSSSLARTLLGPLGRRFAGFVEAHTPREKAIDDFVTRLSLESILILDDARDEFVHSESLIVTNPLQGVSDVSVLEQVRSWADSSKPRMDRLQSCVA